MQWFISTCAMHFRARCFTLRAGHASNGESVGPGSCPPPRGAGTDDAARPLPGPPLATIPCSSREHVHAQVPEHTHSFREDGFVGVEQVRKVRKREKMAEVHLKGRGNEVAKRRRRSAAEGEHRSRARVAQEGVQQPHVRQEPHGERRVAVLRLR